MQILTCVCKQEFFAFKCKYSCAGEHGGRLEISFSSFTCGMRIFRASFLHPSTYFSCNFHTHLNYSHTQYTSVWWKFFYTCISAYLPYLAASWLCLKLAKVWKLGIWLWYCESLSCKRVWCGILPKPESFLHITTGEWMIRFCCLQFFPNMENINFIPFCEKAQKLNVNH